MWDRALEQWKNERMWKLEEITKFMDIECVRVEKF